MPTDRPTPIRRGVDHPPSDGTPRTRFWWQATDPGIYEVRDGLNDNATWAEAYGEHEADQIVTALNKTQRKTFRQQSVAGKVGVVLGMAVVIAVTAAVTFIAVTVVLRGAVNVARWAF